MKAVLLLRQKLTDADGDIWELVVWRVPAGAGLPGVRYRLAFVPRGCAVPAVLYDNHRPKGPHKHLGGVESAYDFVDVPRLIHDFRHDAARSKKERGD